MTMHKMALWLDAEQQRRLEEIARVQHTTLSEVARHALDLGLRQIVVRDSSHFDAELFQQVGQLRERMSKRAIAPQDVLDSLHQIREQQSGD
ncbi:MAG: hypothetical protein OHK0052_18090 [Anaerolineales bacterium]